MGIKRFTTVVVLMALVASFLTFIPLSVAGQETGSAAERTATAVAFRMEMRRLFEDNAIWTRGVIVSQVAGTPDADQAMVRLQVNREDLVGFFTANAGDAMANTIAGMLDMGITSTTQIVNGVKQNDGAALDAATTNWHANADDVATFLNGVSPSNWPLDDTKSLLRTSVDLTVAETVSRVQNDWLGDIAGYDEMLQQALNVADSLSLGIIRQNPGKFASAGQNQATAAERTATAIQFRMELRRLLHSNAVWTRELIISLASDIPNSDVVSNQLQVNITDTAQYVKANYNDAAGSALADLLTTRIANTSEVVNAVKSGDASGLDDAMSSWRTSSENTAVLLAGLNAQNWNVADLRGLFQTSADLTLAEATARTQGAWLTDIASFDDMLQQSLQVADTLGLGIIQQNPANFADTTPTPSGTTPIPGQTVMPGPTVTPVPSTTPAVPPSM